MTSHAFATTGNYCPFMPVFGPPQVMFERGLGMQSTLSVVIEFAGGLFFLWLLLKGRMR
mgnify:CR=1 FL=1